MEKKDYQTDRRKFLAGMGMAGAAALAAPALNAVASQSNMKWDEEHEIVIIGSGFTGLAAAKKGRSQRLTKDHGRRSDSSRSRGCV
jgi:hypothetical protein